MQHRVAMITSALDGYGASRQAALLAKGLVERGLSVHLFALGRPAALDESLRTAGVEVAAIPCRGAFDPHAWNELRGLIARLRPALAHAWQFFPGVMGRTAGLAAGVKRLVVTRRAISDHPAWPEVFWERSLALRTARIVTENPADLARLRGWGLPAERLSSIAAGYVVPPKQEPAFSARRRLNLSDGARLIGSLERLSADRRVKDLIWAADLFKVIGGDVHLLIFGDGPHRRQLEVFRDQCQLRGRVHFLGFQADLDSWLSQLELVWLAGAPSVLPDALATAMAAAVPVVAGDCAAHRELIVHGRTGLLVPWKDRAAFARAARKLLAEPELARRLAAAGQERLAREYAPQTMVDRYYELYAETLA